MRFKPIELICILVCEYLAGLMMFLGACKTIDRIFRYPIKKYTAKSFLFANVHLVLVYLFLCIHVGVDSWYTVIIFSFIIWFFLMEKNVKSLLVSLLASIFSDVVCYGASSIISYFYVWFDLNGGSNSIYKFYLGVFCNTMGFFIALLYILFLGYIGKGKTDEPISVLNMFALLISVFLLSISALISSLSASASAFASAASCSHSCIFLILFSISLILIVLTSLYKYLVGCLISAVLHPYSISHLQDNWVSSSGFRPLSLSILYTKHRSKSIGKLHEY